MDDWEKTAEMREASWSAPALWRFGTGQPSRRSGVSAERRIPCRELKWRLSAESRYAKTAFRMPLGQLVAPGRCTKLNDDGNQTCRAEIIRKRMPADCRRRREESLTKNPKAGNRNESRDLDSYKTKLRNSK
ncbi:MAG: hypothetical protein WCF71_15440, partial [Verrucomicrobiia bacterium]